MDPVFKVKEEKHTDEYGEFVIEPLEPGYGHTVGNALRRVLLTSIPGAAITSVKISGVKHRFSTLSGLKENIVDLLLNLKGVSFHFSDAKTSATIRISEKGPKTITARDIVVSDGVEIVNKDHYLGSLADKKAKLDMEMTVEKGQGYMVVEDRKVSEVGVITTDAIFTPVRRVSYNVSATRVGRQTNLDKLTISIWTNGTITPREALRQAAKVLGSFFMQVYEPKSASLPSDGIAISPSISEDLLKLTIDELDLPTRIYNSLRNGSIETLGQLLGTSKRDLMTMRNMGNKSISIIEDKLREKGISLGV
ncbi:MAG: DNA-directed RNA polymerase subunit alpha [Candidatus Levyibacteriota bacterium]|nr:MAG: DNA-directed RNA polymerase subunit alpha [Candidatus Levybacteria bacterium]